jgi:hypothetical protein
MLLEKPAYDPPAACVAAKPHRRSRNLFCNTLKYLERLLKKQALGW